MARTPGGPTMHPAHHAMHHLARAIVARHMASHPGMERLDNSNANFRHPAAHPFNLLDRAAENQQHPNLGFHHFGGDVVGPGTASGQLQPLASPVPAPAPAPAPAPTPAPQPNPGFGHFTGGTGPMMPPARPGSPVMNPGILPSRPNPFANGNFPIFHRPQVGTQPPASGAPGGPHMPPPSLVHLGGGVFLHPVTGSIFGMPGGTPGPTPGAPTPSPAAY